VVAIGYWDLPANHVVNAAAEAILFPEKKGVFLKK